MIGSCGHVLEGWGAISKLGRGTFVPCPDCSLKETGLPVELGEMPSVWVRIEEKKDAGARLPRKKTEKGAVKKTSKPVRAWQVFLTDD